MDITAFELEDAGRCDLVDASGNPTDAYITLAGPGHAVTLDHERKQGRRAMRDFNKRGKAQLPDDPEELFEGETERLVVRTLGWGGFKAGGQDLPFSKEKARELYENRNSTIRAQVQEALRSGEIFTRSSSTS